MGRVYEYCLSMFASAEGKRGGEFYTPACVVQTLVEVMRPYEGRVYDPACGSGGMFVQSAKFIEAHQGNIQNISVYGQESNPTTWKMCMMNLAIRGIEANLGQYNADSFTNDQHKTLKADYVLANPPFNMDWPQSSVADDPRWKYGLPPSSNANYAWMQHMIHHLAPRGKLGLVLANGSLSSQASGEGRYPPEDFGGRPCRVHRRYAVPAFLYYADSRLPLVYFSRERTKRRSAVYRCSQYGLYGISQASGDDNGRYPEDSKKSTVESWQKDEGYEDEAGFCKTATLEDIKKNDYILTPGRYVGLPEEEDDGIPFEEKMESLTSELSELFAEGRRLEEEVREQLKGIGWEI